MQRWLIIVGETLAYSWFCVGLWLGGGWHNIGWSTWLVHCWVIVGAMLGDGWHTVGFWLGHCWFMVGRMLLYGWRFMSGQRVSNEQSNFGPTKYVAVGPTLNQWLGFGWRIVSVLAG